MHAATMPTDLHPPASLDPDAASGGRLVTTDGRVLPLRHAHLDVTAQGGLARVVLTQQFHNPHAVPLTVRYLLPLPARAAVSGFSFTLDDRLVVGEVQPVAQARANFEKAIVEGRTAALVEEKRSTLFRQQVGNLPPGASLTCELVIDQRLSWLDDGRWAWRFPTVVGPRYMGARGRVPDAREINVPVSADGIDARATLTLRIGDACTGALESPSHAIATEVAPGEAGEGETLVRLGAAAALDRDVVIRWPVARPEVGISVSAARPASPAHSGQTYGLLTLVPPAAGAEMTPRARDLIVLIDTSGSMGGRPLDQAKQVVSALIETLGDRDRLELISFGSRPKRFRREPIVATRNGRKAALKWLRGLKASGGTEMHQAVLEALSPLRDDAQRQVLLVTDGYIGFEQMIIGTLISKLPPDCRLHAVGVGSAPNRTLTEGAARAGRGTELIVGLGEDAGDAAERLVAATAAPLVTELIITGPGLADLAPMQLPDLYAGAPAQISCAAAAGPLTVRGRTADGVFEHHIEVPELALGEGPMAVANLFGRARVDDLEMRLSSGEGHHAIDAEIERTGVQFGIATRKTAWIAVTEARTVKPDVEALTVEQPHAAPYGVSIEGLGLRAVGGAGGGASKAGAVSFGGAPSALGEGDGELLSMVSTQAMILSDEAPQLRKSRGRRSRGAPPAPSRPRPLGPQAGPPPAAAAAPRPGATPPVPRAPAAPRPSAAPPAPRAPAAPPPPAPKAEASALFDLDERAEEARGLQQGYAPGGEPSSLIDLSALGGRGAVDREGAEGAATGSFSFDEAPPADEPAAVDGFAAPEPAPEATQPDFEPSIGASARPVRARDEAPAAPFEDRLATGIQRELVLPEAAWDDDDEEMDSSAIMSLPPRLLGVDAQAAPLEADERAAGAPIADRGSAPPSKRSTNRLTLVLLIIAVLLAIAATIGWWVSATMAPAPVEAPPIEGSLPGE